MGSGFSAIKRKRPGLITYPLVNPLYLERLILTTPADFKACFVKFAGNVQLGKALLSIEQGKGRGPEVVLAGCGFIPQL
jgi:hypothetical protein